MEPRGVAEVARPQRVAHDADLVVGRAGLVPVEPARARPGPLTT